MTARSVVGGIAITYLVVLLVLDVTAWPALTVGVALWVGFAAVDHATERRAQADRDQVQRILDRRPQETTDV